MNIPNLLESARLHMVSTMEQRHTLVGTVAGGMSAWGVWFDQLATVAGKVGAIVGCILAVWALIERVRLHYRRRRERILNLNTD